MVYSKIYCCFSSISEYSCVFSCSCTNKRNQRHKSFQNGIFYAQSDRRNCAWLYMEFNYKRCTRAFWCRYNLCRKIRFLGSCCSDELADDRLYDGYIYSRSAEYSAGFKRGCTDRRRRSFANSQIYYHSYGNAVCNDMHIFNAFQFL